MKKKLIIIIIIIIAGGIISWLIFKGGDNSEHEFTEVKKGELIEKISSTGMVKPAKDVNLRFEISGTVDKVYVSEGQEVKIGDSLIKLYTGKINSQYLQANATYTQSKAELNKFLAGATSQEIEIAQQAVENTQTDLQDTTAKAEINLEKEYDDAINAFDNAYFSADKAMKKLKTIFDEDTLYEDFRNEFKFRNIELKTETKNKKAKASVALVDLEELVSEIRNSPTHEKIDDIFDSFFDNLKIIRNASDSAGKLIDLAIVYSDYSSSQWDTDKSNIETGRTAINTAITNTISAQQAIESQKITNQVNINSAKSALSTAQKKLNQLTAKPREVEIAIYRAKVEKARASTMELAQKLNDATLNSPINGVVAKIKIKIGEVVSVGGDTVISLIAPTKFKVEADITETNIGKVKIGNSAKITLDAFPEKIWPGQVTEMEPAETIIEGVVYYKTTITFKEIDERVKSGMSSDIDIVTNKKENVLYVPYRAIIYREGKKIIRIMQDEKIKEVEVKTGIKDTKGNIEILQGLEEGEKVITFTKES